MYMYRGIVEVAVFSPNRGGAVVEQCGKYTVGNDARRGSRPWSCGDFAGVLAAPEGGVVVTVGGTVLQAWRSGIPKVLPMPFEGSAEGKVRRRYGELAV